MLSAAARVYRETRKKNDQLFNVYVMRPVAAAVVAVIAPTRVTPNQLTLLNLAIFAIAAAALVASPTYAGGLIAIAILELSYCFDCADGMLARWKKLASKSGGLFDFFTDEAKAILLSAALAVRWLGARAASGYDTAAFGPQGTSASCSPASPPSLPLHPLCRSPTSCGILKSAGARPRSSRTTRQSSSPRSGRWERGSRCSFAF